MHQRSKNTANGCKFTVLLQPSTRFAETKEAL